MGTLLELLPSSERRQLEQLMKLRPQDFLERSLIVLQAITSPEQVVRILEKTAENAFINFFEIFLQNCNATQRTVIEGYLRGD
jgi:hypothetical protein